MSAPKTTTDDRELLAVLAGLAELPLDGGRVEELAPLVPGLRQDYATLRERSRELEPHLVFDPRWD